MSREDGFYGEIFKGIEVEEGCLEGDKLEEGVYKVERIVERWVKKVRLNMHYSAFLCI